MILIVEDDASILRGLEDNLKFEGYEVLSATEGQEGLQLALEKAPDLVLLDIMLPGLSGYDVCRKLKAEKPELPIIMLTARGQEVDKVAGTWFFFLILPSLMVSASIRMEVKGVFSS